MGGGAAGGLCRHQRWLPSLPRIGNQVTTARNRNFFYALDEK